MGAMEAQSHTIGGIHAPPIVWGWDLGTPRNLRKVFPGVVKLDRKAKVTRAAPATAPAVGTHRPARSGLYKPAASRCGRFAHHDSLTGITSPFSRRIRFLDASDRFTPSRSEADVVRGRRIASWPSIRTDLRNAGAEVIDEEVVVDRQFTTSRSPADLGAFCRTIVEQFA
ncbi:hypothetical protein FDG2_2322 [Candidatus Protofrankia californiensis]|uniref:DJ-1/PfpI domain-containing protein n=1 Tax=Candidatus Protofrankia californiensis TaxID=1839754 RepID=A0A1C3NXE7_9ACTN|nr:hypothetical protein FDG2_2322 [Candidatus Protofrankia californiensis]